MKNAADAFSFFKQFGHLSLYIGGNGDLVEVFCHFSMYLKDKAFKNLKNQRFFWQFQVTFHMCLDIEKEDDDDHDDEDYNE